jgi:hypothetical protein
MGTRASYLSRLQSVRGTIRQLKSIDFAQATSIPLVELGYLIDGARSRADIDSRLAARRMHASI